MVRKKRTKKTKTRKAKKRKSLSVKRKINLSWKSFLLFLILFLLSYLLEIASSAVFWNNLFGILAIIFGVLSLAMLISLLVFVFIKWFKK